MVIATVHVGSDPIALGQFIDNINLNKSSKSWENKGN